MRYYILTILFMGLIFHARSQQGKDAGQQFIQKKCSIVRASLSLDKQAIVNYPVLFDSIRVLDYRSDTSRIGIVGTEPRYQQDIRFHQPVTTQLSAYFNAGYTYPKGGYHLLVVVKNLWVSNKIEFRHNLDGESAWNISFRFEAYAQVQNGYVPVTYLDTTVIGFSRSAAFVTTRVVPGLIAEFMDKVATHDLDVDVIAKRTVSFEQVDSFCRVRFDYPMDTTTTLLKGVYANVNEFRNNQPSISQYEIGKDKGADITLSIPDGNGHFVYTHTAWGFCDGTQAFVMMDGNVFPILRVHHQFYVLGSREYRSNSVWIPLFIPLGPAAGVSGIMDVSENVKRTLRLFRLNVHSGKVTE
jgi:hypothetical protein